jgi:hypothetical protein
MARRGRGAGAVNSIETMDPVQIFHALEKEMLQQGATATVAALQAAGAAAWSIGMKRVEADPESSDLGLVLGLFSRAAETLQPPDQLLGDMSAYVLSADVLVNGKSLVEICAEVYGPKLPARAVAALLAIGRPVDRIELVEDEDDEEDLGSDDADAADVEAEAAGEGDEEPDDEDDSEDEAEDDEDDDGDEEEPELSGAVVRWLHLDGQDVVGVAVPVPVSEEGGIAEAEEALRSVHEELISQGLPLRRSPNALAFAAFVALGAAAEGDDDDEADDEDDDVGEDVEDDPPVPPPAKPRR